MKGSGGRCLCEEKERKGREGREGSEERRGERLGDE